MKKIKATLPIINKTKKYHNYRISSAENNNKFDASNEETFKKYSQHKSQLVIDNSDIDLHIKIEDSVYSYKEITEILKKYKEEEDKKYNTCYCCGTKYLENKSFNMIDEELEDDIDLKPGTCVGYLTTPIITGIQIQSTCGNGKKIKLCDDCLRKLIELLKGDFK